MANIHRRVGILIEDGEEMVLTAMCESKDIQATCDIHVVGVALDYDALVDATATRYRNIIAIGISSTFHTIIAELSKKHAELQIKAVHLAPELQSMQVQLLLDQWMTVVSTPTCIMNVHITPNEVRLSTDRFILCQTRTDLPPLPEPKLESKRKRCCWD